MTDHPSSLPFVLLAWDAWLPGLEETAEVLSLLRKGVSFDGQTKPKGTHIPPRVRRRCGTLARMTVDCAHQASEHAGLVAAETPLVYASRHGESHVFRKLVAMLSEDEAFSPMAFGNSVHHTPAGYFGMVAGNRGIARALSAGPTSFDCGFIETLALSRQLGGQPVLYVYADEPLLEPYVYQVGTPTHPYALALVLRADSQSEQLTLLPKQTNTAGEHTCKGEPALRFLRWFLDDERTRDLAGFLGDWRWLG